MWQRPNHRSIPLVAGVLLTLLAGAIASTVAGDETTPSGDAAFRAAVDEFIQSELKMFPERATGLGDHRFDNRIDDVSADGIAREVLHATKWMARFGAINPQGLTEANRADRDWLIARCDGELLNTQIIRDYQRDPGMYLPTSAVYSLIQRNFAPLTNRMESVTEREKASLKNFEYARVNLQPNQVPQIAIDINL